MYGNEPNKANQEADAIEAEASALWEAPQDRLMMDLPQYAGWSSHVVKSYYINNRSRIGGYMEWIPIHLVRMQNENTEKQERLFVVEVESTGACFKFEKWEDAKRFRAGRVRRTNFLNRMLGG